MYVKSLNIERNETNEFVLAISTELGESIRMHLTPVQVLFLAHKALDTVWSYLDVRVRG